MEILPLQPHGLLGFAGADTDARYRLLLTITDSIGSRYELDRVVERLGTLLHDLLPYDLAIAYLVDQEKAIARLLSLDSAANTRLRREGLELPLEGTNTGKTFTTQSPLTVGDLEVEPPPPPYIDLFREHAIRSYLLIPLTTAVHKVGVIGFYSRAPQTYANVDLEFVGRVASQMALSIDNTLNFDEARTQQRVAAAQRDRWRALLDVNNALVTRRDLAQLIQRVDACIRTLMRYDHFVLTLYDEAANQLRIAAHASEPHAAYAAVLEQFTHVPIEGSIPGLVFTSRQPVLITRPEPERFPSPFAQAIFRSGAQSACVVPLLSAEGALGVLIFSSHEEARFSQADLEFLVQIGGQVGIAVENAQAFQEISLLKDRLASEKIYLEDEIRSEHNFGEIIGESAALQRALQQVEIVAPTESTVLLLGETGSGKELLARAIHDRSGRRGRTLVKMNCAAIPSGLLESELFGHEKGAFTGAIERKIGRFELAHQGTLFLDEVGDIPLDLQAKLLRVLQDQEFERLGSTRSIKVDVRIVAATNRPLQEMVAERQFRSDLFYRLNVFPITVPPLRDRSEDIPRLVRHFAQKFARQMKKPIDTIPSEAMAALSRWPWPGNVRELENAIERAVIQSKGPVLHVPLAEYRHPPVPAAEPPMTLDVAEREHILKVLRETNWIIGGPNGAAARLGMKRTTLNSRIQKLGISRPRRHIVA